MNRTLESIEWFSLNPLPEAVSHPALNYCWMQEGEHLDQTLDTQYRINKQVDLIRFDAAYRHFFQCQLKALHYPISHLPAIVFNGTEVVYGIDSLSDAIAIWEKQDV
ncbi:DUF1525 domain-containing protein [Legionella fairfieldensis]|uniref:DUF1525 domain-containing protein n=1 Tax=Legionella fairfieldensis TaxID=45064 RepID=UPI000AF74D17|nr:DUF1525 domain-containing protein [Legionella fairfieldensis]